MKHLPRLLLGLAVAGLFLWLTLRHVDMGQLARAAGDISLSKALWAPLFLVAGYGARIRRWQAMLWRHRPDLGFGRTGVAFMAAFAVNNLLPLRAGDALRSFGFTRWLGVGPGAVLATVLVERLLDLVVLILALALALWVFSLDGAALGLARWGGGVLAGLGFAALALLLRPRLLRPLVRAAGYLAARLGSGIREQVDRFLSQLMATLDDLSRRHAMPVLVFWSVLAWFFEGATFWALARAVPALPHPEAAWLAMPAGTLATLIPSSPGHVGTFDYFARTAVTALGNPLVEATLFVLLVHALLWLITTFAGALSLLVWLLRRRDGGKAGA